MTTARDLLIVALDGGAGGAAAEQGDLSLALAGAEVIDLLGTGAVRLDGDRIVPASQPAPQDALLAEAVSSLVGEPPYEALSDWLWRRGRGLAAAYRDALEAEGRLAARSRRGLFARKGNPVPAATPAHDRTVQPRATPDAALTALAEAAGVHGERTADAPDITDDAVAAVLAAVYDAVVELASERQRRTISEAAFDNIWRGPVG
ncbi:GPP34 family phosphoprotein [Streptomyces sp. NPDC012888]|uniref:GOLPH3/VPS74 family protein n=1 Tax=Streptomyces sp. NPDC012888 TaxID=3364855 RepID=UPI0036B86EBF